MTMRIAAVQFQPVFREVESNVAFIEAKIAEVDADVIIFPELATSGYFFLSPKELDPFAEDRNGPNITRIITAARNAKKVVVCGFPERDGSAYYNSAVIGGHGIATQIYRKTHLFYRENQVFAPGDTGFFVVPIPHLDCNLGTMICYDWRFPESARTLALQGADVIACPSNLITDIWPKVMPVRAIENKVYLAVANRTGSEENGGETVSFNGNSTLYSYNGSTLESANTGVGESIVAEIEPAKTRNKSFKHVNDIFADRRPEMYS